MSTQRPKADVQFRFPAGRNDFSPGERLCVEAVVLNARDLDCHAAEVSLLWRTVGQGDEDLEVLAFERRRGKRDAPLTLDEAIAIEAELPESPLSYNGVNVKVCWSARLRLFMGGFREEVAEAPFRLGSTWSPRVKEGASA